MNARTNSHWLKQVIETNETDCPPLDENVRADICIVGGGFTGLWTALHLKKENPSLNIVVIEKNICGGGASGRNGGFVLSWWAKFLSLEKICGGEEAVRLATESVKAVDAIGQFCLEENIDAHYLKDGWLWAATGNQQVDSWNGTLEAISRYQQYPFHPWEADKVGSMSGSARHQSGIFEPSAASVQPAALARGLRRVVMEHGVQIFENTPLKYIKGQNRISAVTPNGEVSAQKIVLAMNAWSIAFSQIRKSIIVVSSDLVITEPLKDQLKAMGWQNGMTISDSRMLVHYYRLTHDGRIAFGKGGMNGSLPFGGSVGTKLDGPSPLAKDVAAWLKWTYPNLSNVRIADSWMGPIDRSKSGLPYFGSLPDKPNVFYGVGYSGNGVGPSYLGGKILASLALEHKNEWSECGLVRPLGRDFPPEPIRYFGGKIVRNAVAKSDTATDENRIPSRLTRYLASFAPAGLSPFKGEKS